MLNSLRMWVSRKRTDTIKYKELKLAAKEQKLLQKMKIKERGKHHLEAIEEMPSMELSHMDYNSIMLKSNDKLLTSMGGVTDLEGSLQGVKEDIKKEDDDEQCN